MLRLQKTIQETCLNKQLQAKECFSFVRTCQNLILRSLCCSETSPPDISPPKISGFHPEWILCDADSGLISAYFFSAPVPERSSSSRETESIFATITWNFTFKLSEVCCLLNLAEIILHHLLTVFSSRPEQTVLTSGQMIRSQLPVQIWLCIFLVPHQKTNKGVLRSWNTSM